jgi:formate dehydrogenase subunit gamma
MNTDRLLRYSFPERLMHALSAVSYVYLLLTGLAFWTPAFYWIATVLGGGYLSRVLHPWIGLVFTIAVCWMLVTWFRDMLTTAEDREWRKAMRHYMRNEDALVPPTGRFNFGQKQFFWLMVLCGAALLISGIALWFTASIPPGLQAVRSLAVLIHAIAALATIGGIIIHIYMGLAVVPGGLHAILHGDVSEQWARHHHGLWAGRAPRIRTSGSHGDRDTSVDLGR